MSHAHLEAVQVWPPVAGVYQMRLVKDGPFVPVRIWYGAAVIDGEPQDRAPGWYVEINGQTDWLERGPDGYVCRVPIDIHRAWPYCARWPISLPDYRFMVDDARYLANAQPNHPKANPRKAVDFATLKLEF